MVAAVAFGIDKYVQTVDKNKNQLEIGILLSAGYTHTLPKWTHEYRVC